LRGSRACCKRLESLQLLLATQHATAAAEVGGWLPDPPCVAWPPGPVLGCLAPRRLLFPQVGLCRAPQRVDGAEQSVSSRSWRTWSIFNIRPRGSPLPAPPLGMAAVGLACGGGYRLLVPTHLSAALRHGLQKLLWLPSGSWTSTHPLATPSPRSPRPMAASCSNGQTLTSGSSRDPAYCMPSLDLSRRRRAASKTLEGREKPIYCVQLGSHTTDSNTHGLLCLTNSSLA